MKTKFLLFCLTFFSLMSLNSVSACTVSVYTNDGPTPSTDYPGEMEYLICPYDSIFASSDVSTITGTYDWYSYNPNTNSSIYITTSSELDYTYFDTINGDARYVYFLFDDGMGCSAYSDTIFFRKIVPMTVSALFNSGNDTAYYCTSSTWINTPYNLISQGATSVSCFWNGVPFDFDPSTPSMVETIDYSTSPHVYSHYFQPALSLTTVVYTFVFTNKCESVTYTLVHLPDPLSTSLSLAGPSAICPGGTTTLMLSASGGDISGAYFTKNGISYTPATGDFNWNSSTSTGTLIVHEPGIYNASVLSAQVFMCNPPASGTVTIGSLASSSSTDVVSACESSLPTTWNGITIPVGATSNTTYTTFTTTNAAGCDSVVTLDLTILPSVVHTDILSICTTDLPTTWNGITIPVGATTNPTYTTFTTPASNGCDSVVTLDLTVNVCSGIEEYNRYFNIYPVLAKNEIQIQSDTRISTIRIIDTRGAVLLQKEIDSNDAIVDISSLVAGTYFVQCDGHVKKFVKL